MFKWCFSTFYKPFLPCNGLKITGNTRGYQLVSSKLEKSIPVSRSFSKDKLTFLIQQKDTL